MKPPLSHLGLGTAQFGAVYGIHNQGRMVSDADMSRILCLARDQGIKTIDTAVATNTTWKKKSAAAECEASPLNSASRND